MALFRAPEEIIRELAQLRDFNNGVGPAPPAVGPAEIHELQFPPPDLHHHPPPAPPQNQPVAGSSGMPKLLTVCSICQGPLAEKGPTINFFSFGQLFKRGPKSVADKALLLKEFPGSNLGRRRYDTSKTLCTPCGHLFHSGCLREWFFVQRDSALAPLVACPFCHQQVALQNCRIVYPSTAEWSTMFKVDTRSIGVGTSDGMIDTKKEPLLSRISDFISSLASSTVVIAGMPFSYILFALSYYIGYTYFGNSPAGENSEEEWIQPEASGIARMEVIQEDSTDGLDNSSWNWFAATLIVITLECAGLCIYAGRRKKSSKCSWIVTTLIALGLFLLSIYFTFGNDMMTLFFGEEDREVEEDEDLDKEIFGEKIYSWPTAIVCSCFLAALADAFL